MLGLSLSSFIGMFQYADINNVSNNNNIEEALSHQKSDQIVRMNIINKLPSIGFRNLLSNLNFLQFLKYFGDDESRERTGYSFSPDFLTSVIEYDPYYRMFYLFLSESTTFYAGQPDKTVSLMEKGLSSPNAHKPSDSYYVWRYKGIDELLFLNDSQAAQASFRMAAEWASKSDDLESDLIATLSRNTAESLAINPTSNRAKISAWSSILTTSFDENTRQQAIEKISELGGEVVFSEEGGVRINYPEETYKNETPK